MSNGAERVFHTPWFHIEKENITGNPNFEGKPFYRLVSPNGVSILPITPDRKVVYVRQFRPALNDYTLELPAGVIDLNEDPLQTAERELYEETGYRCSQYTFLATDLAMIANRSTQRHTLVYGHNAIRSDAFVTREPIEVRTASFEGFKEMIVDGTFKEMAGVAAFSLASLRGLIEV